MEDRLAIEGGTPVRNHAWFPWPIVAEETLALASEALRSQRWAISWPSVGRQSFNQQFAELFAKYCGTEHCILVANGTTALSACMEALDIGPGDEVIVPGLTWVACASTVANLNATPILADIDRHTLCVDPAAVRASITSRTRALMVVHLYSAVADLEALRDLCSSRGIALIEDCAQAHGATWRGKRVGTHGVAGTFSMQNGKVLTAGEGGAVVTQSSDLAAKVRQVISDGRSLCAAPAGRMELTEDGGSQGNNGCLSEIQAAILIDQLSRLDEQQERRNATAALLDRELANFNLRPQSTSNGTTGRTYYQYAVRIMDLRAGRRSVEKFCQALSAELQIQVAPCYRPLSCTPLYQPSRRRRWHFEASRTALLDPGRFELHNCREAAESFVTIPHGCLLGSDSDIEQIVDAFKKVLHHRRSWDAE